MGFDYRLEGEQYLSEQLEGPPSKNYFYSRALGTYQEDQGNDVQLFGGFLRITPGEAQPTPPYDHEESGIVVRGELILGDESGKTVTLREGEIFFIRKESRILFKAERFALVYKCSSYPANALV